MNLEDTKTLEKILQTIVDTADLADLGFAISAAMQECGTTPVRIKKCSYCGGNYDYSFVWAREHPAEVIHQLLIYYKKTDRANKIRNAFKDFFSRRDNV